MPAHAQDGKATQPVRPLGSRPIKGEFTPKTTRYTLTITDTIVNFTGKERKAYAVNGQIPMPTLTFTEGDTALIEVHNAMKHEEASLHWHGIILPNHLDGVPWLTAPPIGPGETQVFKFPVIQNGTYWYHSHTDLQEQAGMYGALIFRKRNEQPTPEYVLVLSEWTDMKPFEVHRRLHTGNDWFAIQKNRLRPGTTQSYLEAIQQGYFGTKVANEWKRMTAMDVSDVYYDHFLSNGRPETEAPQFKAGDRVRMRIINGGASTYFWIGYAGGKMTVVANDGEDVEPVEVDRFIMGVAETYDVIVTIPAEGTAYEFLATAEDRTRSTSVWLGKGVKQLAEPLEALKYFEGMKMMNGMMKMNGDLDAMGMSMSLQQMDMNMVMYPEMESMKMDEDMPGMKHDGMDPPKEKRKDMEMEPDMRKKKKKDGKMDHAMPEKEDRSMDRSKKKEKDDGMDGSMPEMQMGGMDHGKMTGGMPGPVTLNYAMLRSPNENPLPPGPIRELRFELTGNMNRYLWSIDNRTVSETDKILIRQGENVRIILFNNSMMRHPMHLHGHFFRVLNGQGDHVPLKNVLDIMPMETDTIEFAATEYGDWFFHCHVLYHMMSGMGRVFSYSDSPPNPMLPDPKMAWRRFLRDDRRWHFMVQNDFATNGNDGEAMLREKRWELNGEWRLGYTDVHGQEVETHFGRYLGKMQWWFPYIGYDWRQRTGGHNEGTRANEINLFQQSNTSDNRSAAFIGMQYTLPMLILIDARMDTDGRLRTQLTRRDIVLTPRLRMDLMYNTDFEYMAGLRYVLGKTLAVKAHYDSDMGAGVGVTVSY